MRRAIHAIAVVWVCLLMSNGLLAATLRVPGDHATIHAAYLAASRGDEILVAPGVYHERIPLDRFGVTIRSEAGPEQTVIDAQSLGSVFVITPLTDTESFAVEGFTIRNGRSAQGGAFDFARRAALTLRHCVLERNEATHGRNQGGAIFAPDIQGAGAILIEDCVFQDNFAGGPGGLPKGGAMRASAAEITLRRSVFRRNVPNACVVGDGPILVEDCEFSDQESGLGVGRCESLTVRNTRFLRHDSPRRGPGLSVQPGTTALVEDCLFEGNHANGFGGASEVEHDAYATYVRCTFRNNTSGAYAGAVALLQRSWGVFEDCVFEDNWARNGGGAVEAGSADATFTRCVFRGNTIDGAHGAALHLYGRVKYGGTRAHVESCDFIGNGGAAVKITENAEVTIVGSRFLGNPPDGRAIAGGLWIELSTAPVVVANCLFAGNRTDMPVTIDPTGSAIMTRSNAVQQDITIVNCAFVGNQASASGAAVFNRWGANPRLINCVFAGNTPRDIVEVGDPSEIVVAYSVLSGGWEGDGNIDGVPLFLDPLGADGAPWTGDENYAPAPGSPVVDSGDSQLLEALGLASSSDLSGGPRIVDALRYDDAGVGLKAGGVVDAGPVEAPAGLLSPCAGDADGDLLVTFFDLSVVLAEYGAMGEPLLGDVNGDRRVNFADLNAVLSAFGRDCTNVRLNGEPACVR